MQNNPNKNKNMNERLKSLSFFQACLPSKANRHFRVDTWLPVESFQEYKQSGSHFPNCLRLSEVFRVAVMNYTGVFIPKNEQ